MQLFLMVNMASGMDEERVRSMTTTSCNMAAIQLNQVMQSWITAYIFHIRRPYYVQVLIVRMKHNAIAPARAM